MIEAAVVFFLMALLGTIPGVLLLAFMERHRLMK